ncbi:GH25 family lysozyme [Butyrivibrio sp. XPD2006]|uniref:GH25 family lysozyme n=1 Tax=Butyrivibrio sp. XPD2006 TaxID=1280668 RepID=UPI00042A6532|nr:GH25 family lysozyme [Butyrivibrio sp. XPD2006]
MKRSLKLFNKIGKKPRRRQDIKDYEEEYEDDFYEEDDYDEEFDEEYGDEDYAEDEDYADDEDYGEDEDYPEYKPYSREKHGDFDHELREDDDFDLEPGDRGYEEDYPEDEEDYPDEDEDYPEEDENEGESNNVVPFPVKAESEEVDIEDDDIEDDYHDEDDVDEEYTDEDYADDDYSDDAYLEDESYDADEEYEDTHYVDDEVEPEPVESDDYEDDDYDPEFDEAYGSQIQDDSYAEDDYRDEAEDDRYEEADVDDRYDDDYRDEDDDYYRGAAVAGVRGGRSSRDRAESSRNARSERSPKSTKRSRGHRHHNEDGIGVKILEFIKKSSFAERAAAVIAILLVAGGIVTMSFYSKALDRNAEISAFAEVGADMQFNEVIGSSGLLAVADAERARAMTAEIILEEEEEEEEEVPDDAPGVTVKMTLTTIKSDMKVKFINSETKKLVANVPFTISVVTPDGTTVTYDDHDKDGIIYKNNLTAGKYKVTPNALPAEFSNYSLDLGAQALTIKDTVETKVVDVSNEIKKESQVNAAKEDTAVQTVVESALTDTVEWVDSNQGSATGSGDGNYNYEEVSKESVANLISGAAVPSGSVKRLSARRGRTETPSEGSSDASTEASTEQQEVAGETRTSEEGTSTDASKDNSGEAASDSASNAASDNASNTSSENAGNAASTVNTPKDMSLGSSSVTVNADATASVSVSGPSQISAASANTAVAEVSVSGTSITIKGMSPGTTFVTVDATDYNQAKISVTVNPAPLKTISLSTTSLTLKSGDEGRIEVSGVSGITVSPTDSPIASVSVSGTTITVKGNAVGEARFSVSTTGYEPASFTVVVAAPDKKDMTVNPADKTVSMRIGEEKSFTVSGPSSISASSDKAAVAAVEASGTTFKIKAVAAGTANIKIEADGYNPYTISVTVSDGSELKLNSNKITLVPGKTFKLTAEVSGATPTFTSADTNIAKVEADGTITGVGAGETTIKVTCPGYKEATATVKVIAADTILKDKDGNTLWVKEGDGYREAKYSDYFNPDIKVFYIRKEGDGVRHGWWTIDGKTYYYDKDGNPVTGEQVIKGAKYSFGSDGVLSSSSGTMGIDVSKWNGNIDWNKVKKSGVNFVIIRCGYRGSSAGALIEDPKFRSYMKGAQAAGLKVGVYFFSQAVNEVEAVEEASMCINLCQGYNLSFPIYLDVEGSNGRGDTISASQRTANIKAFCGTIQSAGYRAGVYSNKTWFTKNINVSALTNYKIWLAQYAASVSYSASRYDMWQYTSKGSVSGISGNVDMNILYN